MGGFDVTPRSAWPTNISLAARPASTLSGGALAAAYVVIWCLRQGYGGIRHDAQLYAFQAMARLQPSLGSADLFLQYGSQDDYTIFPLLYSWMIGQVGLTNAALGLTLIFKFWFTVAAWALARRFTTRSGAWLCTGVMLVLPHDYGALQVFEFSENFLTARSIAEPLSITALALGLHGRWRLGAFCVLGALLMHPLIAAPAALLLFAIWLPPHRRFQALIGAGVLTAIILALATVVPTPPFLPMDDAWLELVRYRSNFMFIDLWPIEDFDWALLSIVTLLFSALVHSEPYSRRMFSFAAVVGATGLMLTAFVSLVIPIEIIVQGQPWRWMWIATCLATLSLASTLAHCVRLKRAATLSAAAIMLAAWVLPSAWALPSFIATPLAGIAVGIYLMRERLSQRILNYIQILAILTTVLMLASLASVVQAMLQMKFDTGAEPVALQRARDWFGVTIPALVAVFACWALTVHRGSIATAACVLAISTAATASIAPSTRSWTSSPYGSERDDFAAWRAAVDQRRSVLWTEDAAASWLLLDSPSYTSIAQTAGIAFSRETAMEAKRRAAALRPLSGHDLLTIDTNLQRNIVRPLTLEGMRGLCSDPILGYVVTRTALPIEHLSLPSTSARRGLRLYSCDSLVQNP